MGLCPLCGKCHSALLRIPSTVDLAKHARDLAAAFSIRIIESPLLQPHEACALPHLRAVLGAPVIDETTYAVMLHELGHLAAATGSIRHGRAVDGNRDSLQRVEEAAAWAWARHYALHWTAVMEALSAYAESTYAAPAAPAPAPVPDSMTPPVPVAPIDWQKYGRK